MKTGKSFQSSAAIEPNTLTFLQTLRAKPASQTVEDARRAESSMQAVEVAKLPADIEDRIIPGGPNGTIAIRIGRPKGNNDNLPVVMYFHGGGWVVGGKDTHDRLIREIANGGVRSGRIRRLHPFAGSTVSRGDRGGIRSHHMGQAER